MEKVLLFFIAASCLGGLILYVKNYLEDRKQRKAVDAVLAERSFVNDEMDVEFQPEQQENIAVFLKLPIDIRSNYGKTNVEKLKKCEDCYKRAENLGVDVSKICPELNCDENESEKYTIESTYDYVRPQDIKGFLTVKDGLNIAFYDGQVIHYTITEDDFLDMISEFVEIIDYAEN